MRELKRGPKNETHLPLHRVRELRQRLVVVEVDEDGSLLAKGVVEPVVALNGGKRYLLRVACYVLLTTITC